MKNSNSNKTSNYRGSDEPSLRHGMRIPVTMSPNIVRGEIASATLVQAALRGDLHRGVEIPQKTAFQGSLHLGPTSPHQGYTGGDPGASPYIPLRKGHTTDPYPVEAFAAPIGAHQRTTSDSPIRNHSEHSRATPVSSIPPVALARSKRPAGKIKP